MRRTVTFPANPSIVNIMVNDEAMETNDTKQSSTRGTFRKSLKKQFQKVASPLRGKTTPKSKHTKIESTDTNSVMSGGSIQSSGDTTTASRPSKNGNTRWKSFGKSFTTSLNKGKGTKSNTNGQHQRASPIPHSPGSIAPIGIPITNLDEDDENSIIISENGAHQPQPEPPPRTKSFLDVLEEENAKRKKIRPRRPPTTVSTKMRKETATTTPAVLNGSIYDDSQDHEGNGDCECNIFPACVVM